MLKQLKRKPNRSIRQTHQIKGTSMGQAILSKIRQETKSAQSFEKEGLTPMP
jgi:hypothetical protein